MKSLRKKIIGLILLAIAPITVQASTIYATVIESAADRTSVLVSIDSATGEVTELGSTGVEMQSMAYDSTNNILYGAGSDPLDPTAEYQLYIIDRATGVTTAVGTTGSQFVTGMTYDSDADILYAQTGFVANFLATVDRQSGLATSINPGMLGISTVSLEYIPGSGQLAFVNIAGQYGYYNPLDGSFQINGSGGLADITGLAYDASLEQLLGINGNTLFSVDIDSGLATAIVDIEQGFYGSMAIVPVPLPGALLFLVSGLGLLGFARKE